MSLILRILLIIASLLVLVFVLKKIRKTQLYIDDAIYWIVFSFLLVIISIFPQIPVWASELLGIESPANFVFLFVLFVVLVKLFQISIDLSVQRHRLNRLVQKLAIMDAKQRENKEEK